MDQLLRGEPVPIFKEIKPGAFIPNLIFQSNGGLQVPSSGADKCNGFQIRVSFNRKGGSLRRIKELPKPLEGYFTISQVFEQCEQYRRQHNLSEDEISFNIYTFGCLTYKDISVVDAKRHITTNDLDDLKSVTMARSVLGLSSQTISLSFKHKRKEEEADYSLQWLLSIFRADPASKFTKKLTEALTKEASVTLNMPRSLWDRVLACFESRSKVAFGDESEAKLYEKFLSDQEVTEARFYQL